MWWFGSAVLAGAVWWALWATGTLFIVSMTGAFALVVAAGVGLERGRDMQLWAWVMLCAITTLGVGMLVL